MSNGWSGFDFSEFRDLIRQIEQLGADSEQIAEKVLDAGSEPARQAFINHVPYDSKTPEERRQHPHARDFIKVSKTQKSKKYGNKYRIIGASDGKISGMRELKRKRNNSKTSGEEGMFAYLTYVEYGHSEAPAHPFLQKAYEEARAAASEPMRQALIQEINNHLR